MQGYVWAKTPENQLFVVLIVDGRGYVPGVENAIELDEFFILEPVTWPSQTGPPSQISVPPKPGALAPVAMRGSATRLYVVNG